jgi:hypothetical protein
MNHSRLKIKLFLGGKNPEPQMIDLGLRGQARPGARGGVFEVALT